MTNSEETLKSAAWRLNQLHQNDDFFQQNTFTEDEIKSLMMDVVLENNLTDEHLAALVAIGRAIRGTHPYMAIDIKAVPAGVIPRPLRDIRKARLMMDVADQIDMQVAAGVKQDAAIHEAMDKFKLSRRETFRLLKDARAKRIRMRDQEEEFENWDYWYKDFLINKSGRLVPRKEKS